MTRRTFFAGSVVAGACAASAASSDPGYWTTTESIDAIRRKKISATELLNSTWRRVDRYNAKINAIVIQFRERSLVRARAADEALAKGKRLGPLHGIPVTIKEAFAYKASPNSWAREEFKGIDSERTATAVERLEAAGAIVIGKTNVPPGLADIQCFNAIYGTTNNPYDLTRTPGGSTGGGAAAVAAGLGQFSVGSDSGGSIRTPAHLCGIYGHKPTVNLVSLAGHQPGPWDGKPSVTSFDFQVAGPLARSASDLAFALGVLGGPSDDEAVAWAWKMPPSRRKRLREFRVGYVMGGGKAPLAAELGNVYENLLSALSRTGAALSPGLPDGIDQKSQEELLTYLGSSRFARPKEEMERYRRRLERDSEDMRALAFAGPHSRWLKETNRQLGFRAIWQDYFKDHDVCLMPPACAAAFPHDQSQPFWERRIVTPDGKWSAEDFGYWSVFASLAGIPSTVAPVGKTGGGLPIGIQILGPMWEDATPIQFASLLADLGATFTPPEGFGF